MSRRRNTYGEYKRSTHKNADHEYDESIGILLILDANERSSSEYAVSRIPGFVWDTVQNRMPQCRTVE